MVHFLCLLAVNHLLCVGRQHKMFLFGACISIMAHPKSIGQIFTNLNTKYDSPFQ